MLVASEWSHTMAMTLDQTLDRVLPREYLKEADFARLRGFPRDQLLAQLERRFEEAQSNFVRWNIFDVCADLGPEAAPLVRKIIQQPITNEDRACRALAKCLGDEGFDLFAPRLANAHPRERVRCASALLEFDCKERILDWIEATLSAQDPITPDWGPLAALAGITWERVTRWLDRGKPLGLVALDAMNACRDDDSSAVIRLRDGRPKLRQPVDLATMRARLRWYAAADASPRTQRLVSEIDQHLEEIVAG
jgi:hypothetical protein